MPDEFRVGEWHVQAQRDQMVRGDRAIHIEPKVMELLSYLADRRGEVVPKERLIQEVWPDAFVTDEVLSNAIWKLRQALGDDPKDPTFIQTVPKKGYRLLAPVSAVQKGVPALRKKLALRYRWALAGAVIPLVAFLSSNVGSLRERPSEAVQSVPLVDSIAVLPLQDLSGRPDEEYFADGMTEALITELGKIGSGLRVISRQSTRQYKDTDKAIPVIAGELGVDLILEGTALRDGDMIRITVNLINASPEGHLWSASFQEPLSSILSLQQEVAEAVSRQIQGAVAKQNRPFARIQVEPEAHIAYSRGLYYLRQEYSQESYRQALVWFEKAIDIDPAYAPAYSGLAVCFSELGFYWVEPETAFPQAVAAANKALELDPSQSAAAGVLADVSFYSDWDWEESERLYRQALALNPNDAGLRNEYSIYLLCMGRFDEALAENASARQLDPLNEGYYLQRAWFTLEAGRLDEAIALYRKILQVRPTHKMARYQLAWCYSLKEMHQEAVAELVESEVENGGMAVYIYARAGQLAMAHKLLDELLELKRTDHFDSLYLMVAYMGFGDNDRALEWLEKAYQERSPSMIFLKIDPIFDPLRSSPRYIDLLDRMGL